MQQLKNSIRNIDKSTKKQISCEDCGRVLNNDLMDKIMGNSLKYVDGYRCRACGQNKDALLRELAIYNVEKIRKGLPIMKKVKVKEMGNEEINKALGIETNEKPTEEEEKETEEETQQQPEQTSEANENGI